MGPPCRADPLHGAIEKLSVAERGTGHFLRLGLGTDRR